LSKISLIKLNIVVANGKKRLKVQIFIIIGALLFAALSVILALMFQDDGENDYNGNAPTLSTAFFIVAAIFLLLAVLAFLLYFKTIRSGWYFTLLASERLLNYRQYIQENKIDSDSINTKTLAIKEKPINHENLKEFLAEKLEDYSTLTLQSGILFYSLAANALHHAKSAIDGFFIVNEDIKNSYDRVNENIRIRHLAKEVNEKR